MVKERRKKKEILAKEAVGKADKEKPKLDAQEKQLRIIVFVAVTIILLVLIAFLYTQSLKSFEYKGIKFEKTYLGDIAFYTANVPVKDSYDRITGYNTFDFRKDPRKLENIPMDIKGGIFFSSKQESYVSTKGDISTCEGDTGLALINQALLISSFGFEIKGAFDDPAYKNSTQYPYVNCQTNPDNTVILIKEGNETKIEQTGLNCYEISFKDCEVLEAVEKFELAILEQVYS